MLTTINKVIEVSFSLGKDDIKGITQLLECKVGEVRLSAQCRDDAEREFEDLSELLTFDNLSPQRIVKLSFRAGSDGGNDVRIHLHFESERRGELVSDRGRVHISATGQNDACSNLVSDIEAKVLRLRPWYYYASMMRSDHIMFILITIEFILIGVLSSLYGENSDISLSISETVTGVIILGVGAIFVAFLCLNAVRTLRQRIFPSGVFLIGDQIRIHKLGEKWRGFMLTLVAGMIVVLLQWGLF